MTNFANIKPAKKQKQGGFTLMEIAVVTAILAVLVATAVPNFLIHIERTRATETIQLLDSLLKAQRAFFYENGAYTNNLSDLEIDVPASPSYNAPAVSSANPIVSISRNDGSYTLRVSSAGVYSCIPAGATCTKLGF